jgi:hypothetical protein
VRAVAGQPATIRLQVQTDGGTPVAPDALPSVTVFAGDGVTQLYSATGAAVGGSTGAYTWALPPQAKLDQLTAIWTYLVSGVAYTQPVTVNVVAGRLVHPYTLRQADTNLAACTDEQLLFLIDQAEDLVEDVLGYPPVLTGARQEWDVLRGTLTDALYISGTVNGLPYGWGAGEMLIPGFRYPVVGSQPAGTAALYTSVAAGSATSVQLAGNQVGKIGAGYLLEIGGSGSGLVATTTSTGTFDGTKTTYTVAALTVPVMIASGGAVPWSGPPSGAGAVYAGSINGVALDPVADIPMLRVLDGALAWADYRPWISGRYQMWFTHGAINPPADLRAATQKLISHAAKVSNYPERAAQVITEGATILFSLPSPDRPTGLPEVDAVLVRRRTQSEI